MDHCSLYEFGTRTVGQEQHVIFHWDQEPIWSNSLGKYDQFSFNYNNPGQYLCVLANSEHSELKQQVVKERNMADWYFFYHGFLALDWFRDAQYLGEIASPIKHYLSLNHILQDQRAYRMALTARLFENQLDKFGTISFHGQSTDCIDEINKPQTRLSVYDKRLIERYLVSNDQLPLRVDDHQVNGLLSAHFGYHEYLLWQQSLFHVVNETVFYEPKLHLTEKIFKPIVAGRPFLLVAAPGNLSYLRTYGFKTFSAWIDESYDNETDNDKRLDKITSILKDLCCLSQDDLQQLYKDMQPVLQYNRNHFFSHFKELIVDEMIGNFDSCLALWNDRAPVDKKIKPHPDLSLAKSILTR